MNYDLQIKKSGKIITREWDFDESDYIERNITDDEILFYTHDTICLEDGITLKDIFLLIATNIEIYSVITACPFLIELVEEALEPANFYKDSNSILALGFNRNMMMNKKYIEEEFDFYAVGENGTYSLDMFPINELISYPIYLNENVLFSYGKKKFKLKRTFTLSEFLNGIINELSFVGPPDIREFTLESLKDQTFGEQNFKQFTSKDIEKKIKLEKRKNKIPCKNCGEDARADCFGKPKDLCEKCFKIFKEN